MNKTELIAAIHSASGYPKKDVEGVLQYLDAVIHTELPKGSEITVPGIGKLTTKMRSARAGRNPSTGAAIAVPAKRVVQFKPEKSLRDIVAGA